MGLDMYLYAKKHISNYDFYPTDKILNREIKEALGLDHYVDKDETSLEVSLTVAYWRKANQIHAWFVRNCQYGNDDCQEYFVSRESLMELRDICNKAVETRDPHPLPPQGGFFFGSTVIDEYFWDDIESTAKKLTEILDDKELKNYEFTYRASW